MGVHLRILARPGRLRALLHLHGAEWQRAAVQPPIPQYAARRIRALPQQRQLARERRIRVVGRGNGRRRRRRRRPPHRRQHHLPRNRPRRLHHRSDHPTARPDGFVQAAAQYGHRRRPGRRLGRMQLAGAQLHVRRHHQPAQGLVQELLGSVDLRKLRQRRPSQILLDAPAGERQAQGESLPVHPQPKQRRRSGRHNLLGDGDADAGAERIHHRESRGNGDAGDAVSG